MRVEQAPALLFSFAASQQRAVGELQRTQQLLAQAQQLGLYWLLVNRPAPSPRSP